MMFYAAVSRAQITAPPGFSVPSRAPPPGFSSHERLEQAFDSVSGSLLFLSTFLCVSLLSFNGIWYPPDREFYA